MRVLLRSRPVARVCWPQGESASVRTQNIFQPCASHGPPPMIDRSRGQVSALCRALWQRSAETTYEAIRYWNTQEETPCRSDQPLSWPLPLQRAYKWFRRSQMEVTLPAPEMNSRTITRATAHATRDDLLSCPPPLHLRNKTTGCLLDRATNNGSKFISFSWLKEQSQPQKSAGDLPGALNEPPRLLDRQSGR
jgi:hypothetical protein